MDNEKLAKEQLTVEDVQKASDRFFPLFQVVRNHMPNGSTTEDTLKVMETVCKLAHKIREEEKEENTPFGFNKKSEEKETFPSSY